MNAAPAYSAYSGRTLRPRLECVVESEPMSDPILPYGHTPHRRRRMLLWLLVPAVLAVIGYGFGPRVYGQIQTAVAATPSEGVRPASG